MRRIGLLAVVFCSFVFAADLQLRVIEPRHSDAEELLPLVRELLHGEESVSLYRNSLVINAYPETLTRVDQLLRDLDTPRHNLLIHLRRHSAAIQHEGGDGVSGSIDVGNSGSTTRDTHTTTVIRTTREVSTRDAGGAQSVRALEGKSVLIRDGQLVALPARAYWGYGVEYEDVQRGLIVTATLRDDTVRLDIDARDDRVDSGTIRSGALRSSVSGRLGEWIYLGGSSDASTQGTRSIGARYSTRSEDHGDYEIMVERID